MAKKTIEHAAAKGEFLTLDELAAWVQDVMRAGVDGSTVVKAVVSFGGKLQKVSVQADMPTAAKDATA